MVEISEKMWSTGEGNGKPLQYSCLENPMNSMKRQNDRILKEELPRSVGATPQVQYVTGDQWRNNSRKNEGKEPKQKKTPFPMGERFPPDDRVWTCTKLSTGGLHTSLSGRNRKCEDSCFSHQSHPQLGIVLFSLHP